MITKYDNICFLCGKPRQHIHHLIFGTGNRPLCDSDGITAPVCFKCHEMIHQERHSLGTMSKIVGQLDWEIQAIERGMTGDDAREAFRKKYGRSWL